MTIMCLSLTFQTAVQMLCVIVNANNTDILFYIIYVT